MMELMPERDETYTRFASWMSVLNDAVEGGYITVLQARSLLLDIVKKAEQPWA